MENVMTIGFCELNEKEMNTIDGGFELSVQIGPVTISVDNDDFKSLGNWYMNTYVPAAMDFGGKVYDFFN